MEFKLIQHFQFLRAANRGMDVRQTEFDFCGKVKDVGEIYVNEFKKIIKEFGEELKTLASPPLKITFNIKPAFMSILHFITYVPGILTFTIV